jgi:DNA-binding response OmpR family regulator
MERGSILVATSDTPWATQLARMLVAEGYRVSLARTGVDALYQARRQRPHLIFLDPDVSQLSGWEVCRQLKRMAEHATLTIVLMTLDAKAAHRAGADGYMAKSGQVEPSLPPVHAFRAPQGIVREFLHRRMLAA